MYNYLRKNKKRGLSMIEYLKIKQNPVSVLRKKKKYSRIKKKRNSVLILQKNKVFDVKVSPILKLQKRNKFMKKLLLKRSFLRKKKSTMDVLSFLKPKRNSVTITRKFAFKLYNYKFKFRQKINFYNATL